MRRIYSFLFVFISFILLIGCSDFLNENLIEESIGYVTYKISEDYVETKHVDRYESELQYEYNLGDDTYLQVVFTDYFDYDLENIADVWREISNIEGVSGISDGIGISKIQKENSIEWFDFWNEHGLVKIIEYDGYFYALSLFSERENHFKKSSKVLEGVFRSMKFH